MCKRVSHEAGFPKKHSALVFSERADVHDFIEALITDGKTLPEFFRLHISIDFLCKCTIPGIAVEGLRTYYRLKFKHEIKRAFRNATEQR